MKTAPLSALVSVVIGGAMLAQAGCDGPTGPEIGSAQVTVTTTGEDFDLDGYVVSVDGGVGLAVGVNWTMPFSELSAGTHSVALTGIAPNCAVRGANPRPVVVTRNGTTPVAFEDRPFGRAWRKFFH